MFGKVRRLKMNNRFENIELRLKQLECPHHVTHIDPYFRIEKCTSCGETVHYFSNGEALLKAQISRVKQELDRYKNKLKRLKGV